LLLTLTGHCIPPGGAAAGGIIRSEQGYFVKAFSVNLGSYSITCAEMRAIVEGLKLVWSLGIKMIRFQSDCKAATIGLSDTTSHNHQHVVE
ncbi:hypothetical protein LINGRAHAP2_LOCUS10448, partial [Linum grandiflorum]